MMKRCSYFIILLCLLLAACQPSPVEKVVKGKQESLLDIIEEGKINDTADIKAINGNVWVEEDLISSENVSVIINAEIRTQDVNKYPILRVKNSEIDTTSFSNAIEYFFGNTPVFYWTGLTKEECEQKVVEISREIASCVDEGNLESLMNELERYEKEYLSAPSMDDDIVFDIEHPIDEEYMKVTGFDAIVLKAYLDNGLVAGLVNQKGIISYHMINSNDFYYHEVGFDAFAEETKPSSIGMNIDEAIKVASESVEAVLPNAMELVRVATINKGTHYMDIREIEMLPPECLVLYFTKSYNGVNTTYCEKVSYFSADEDYDPYDQTNPNYRPFIYTEYIRVVVDNNAIVEWLRIHPKETVEQISDNVSLLPFESIKEIFRQQAVNELAYESKVVISRDIVINKIVLGMMAIGEKDNNDGQLVVPVWDFIGTQTINHLVDGTETSADYSFLTINAIDGSIIDRSKGY